MTETEHSDEKAWEQAVDWIMREHEGSLDEMSCLELRNWLAEAPAHRKAYEQARSLWLITGLIPTVDEQNYSSPDDEKP